MIQTIEDFIGIYDGAVSSEECRTIISCFENMKNLGFTRTRQQLGEGYPHEKQDESMTPYGNDYIVLPGTNHVVSNLVDILWKSYEQYCETFSILNSKSKMGILGLKIQKTNPGEGFHVWHYENPGRFFSHRLMAFTYYLNNVNDGGETEFLYLKKRIKPIEGRLLIWPAAYTHTHRGNPPLSHSKYIVTGWIEWMD